MKNGNKIFVEELAIFGGAVILAGSTIGLVLNAFNAPSVVNIIYKGKEVSMTASADGNVSIDAYERTTYDENGEHGEKIYVCTPSVVNIIHKGKKVSITAYSGWDVSFDDYVLCGNCDHVKNVYVYTPKHRK